MHNASLVHEAERPGSPMKYVRQLAVLMLILAVFSPLLLVAKGGTDFDRYMYWGLVFKYADIFQLRSSTLSPCHIPYSQWSFGPGLIFSIGLFFNKLSGALYVGWVFTALFWVTFTGVLRSVTGDRKELVMLGLLLTFVGTPLGYYSSNYSSESLSYACLSAALYWLLTGRNTPKVIDHLIVGVSLSLLVAIRPQLVVYCLPLLALIYFDLYQAYKTLSQTRLKVAAYLSASHLPLVLSVAATGIINYWMTGSALSSPYIYSHGLFNSMEWLDPEFMAILANPYHGLLIYHPLYLVLFTALVALMFHVEGRPAKFGIGVVMMALLAHLYIHAAWYWWWLADSFGMRGVSISAVFLIPAFIYLLMRLQQRRVAYYALLLTAALSTCWSFAMLLQPEAICLDFSGISIVVDKSLQFVTGNMVLLSVLFTVALIVSFVIPFTGRVERTIVVALNALLGFYLSYNVWQIRKNDLYFIYFIAIGMVILVTLLINSNAVFLKKPAGFSLLIVYGFCIVLLARMSVSTADVIRNNSADTGSYKYISSIDVDLINMCYRQYVDIPGYEEKKQKLREFRDYVNRSFINPHFQKGL